ncbi:hypothetical protein ACVJDU_000875 [Bradyrhizobium diazoefficiens]
MVPPVVTAATASKPTGAGCPLGRIAAIRLSSMKIVPFLMTSPSVAIVTIRPVSAHRFGFAAGLMESPHREW